jgi:hypothetical protein
MHRNQYLRLEESNDFLFFPSHGKNHGFLIRKSNNPSLVSNLWSCIGEVEDLSLPAFAKFPQASKPFRHSSTSRYQIHQLFPRSVINHSTNCLFSINLQRLNSDSSASNSLTLHNRL